MKKEMIEVPIEFFFSWNGMRTIEEIEAEIAILKELGATHIDIDSEEPIGFDAYRQRPETDEELEIRKRAAKDVEEEVFRRERLRQERIEELKRLRNL